MKINHKVMTLSFTKEDADYLQNERKKGMGISFIIRMALQLYKQKVTK